MRASPNGGAFSKPETGKVLMPTNEEELEAERPAEDAEESQWKAFARKWEQRAKAKPSDDELAELKKRAERADELETAGQTDIERLTQRAEAAERERDGLRTQLNERDASDERSKLVSEIAEAKGIPDASLLVGDTREDIEAYADKLAALLPEKPKVATDGSGGDRGEDIEGGDASAKEIADTIRI
ncbi:MAG: hypothetical protein ACTH31_03845 [Pseudoclavibacter sp.]